MVEKPSIKEFDVSTGFCHHQVWEVLSRKSPTSKWKIFGGQTQVKESEHFIGFIGTVSLIIVGRLGMYRILVVHIRYYWGTVGVVIKGMVNEFKIWILSWDRYSQL